MSMSNFFMNVNKMKINDMLGPKLELNEQISKQPLMNNHIISQSMICKFTKKEIR